MVASDYDDEIGDPASSGTKSNAVKNPSTDRHEAIPSLVKSATDESTSDEESAVMATAAAEGSQNRSGSLGDANDSNDGTDRSHHGSGGDNDNNTAPPPLPSSEHGSLRETLRARLRAQEARLKGLVRNASSDGAESAIGQMKAVQQQMRKVEDEKTELERELERLRGSITDGEDEFLKEKMAGIQEGFDKQVRTIQLLQRKLERSEEESDNLRSELVRKLQRIVELEFDLETHEIHYTSYAAEQFQLGEDALNEIKASKKLGEENPNPLQDSQSSIGGVSSSTGGSGSGSTARKAQKLISKLLFDLDSLEARYKEEKIRSMSEVERLSLANDDLRAQMEAMRQRLGEAENSSSSISEEFASGDGSSSFETFTITQLRKRLEIAEARKSLFRKEVNHLRVVLEETKAEATGDERRAKLEIQALADENDALRAHIAKLEAKKELGKKDGGGGLLKKKRKDDAGSANNQKAAAAAAAAAEANLVQKIQKSYRERCRLENAVEIKDKQISTLKKEVANLRLKDISDGNVNDSMYTEFDANLLKSAPSRSRSSYSVSTSHRPGESGGVDEDDGADGAYVADLRRQLQEAQHQLVKKDQELVIERAKAASTAAGLLARITELTGKKVDGKAQKQVPLRFYL